MKNLNNVDRPCPPGCEHCKPRLVEMEDGVEVVEEFEKVMTPKCAGNFEAMECEHEPVTFAKIKETEDHESKLGKCQQMRYERGHKGLGFVVSEFGGDGTCSIFASRASDGCISEVIIRTPAYEPPKEREIDMELEYLGKIGIDTGRFLVMDPCYLFKPQY